MWPMALVAAIVLIVSGPMVLLFTSNMTEQSAEVKSTLLTAMIRNLNVGFCGFELIFPIIVAIGLFKYLHTAGGVAVVHALPLTRDTLFRSNVLSGLILIFSPIVLTTLILIPFMSPGLKGLSYHFGSGEQEMISGLFFGSGTGSRMPDIGDLLGWFIIAAVVVLFVYAVSILSVIITGNSGIGFVSAGLLNFIVPILFLLTVSNLDHLLYGYSLSGDTMTIASSFQPLSYTLVHAGVLRSLTLAVFVLISVAVFIGALLLYRVYKSERAGDTIVFKSLEYTLTWLVTFIGMIAGGFLFEQLTGDTDPVAVRGVVHTTFFIGALIGAVLTFAVVTMVVHKSPKALDKKSLKSFGCFAVIAVVFFVFVGTNITGFETRVPAASAVKKAGIHVDDYALRMFPYMTGYVITSGDGSYRDMGRILSEEPEMIDALIAFHREIIEKASDRKYEELFTFEERPDLTKSDYLLNTRFAAQSWSKYELTYDVGSKYKTVRSYSLTSQYIDNSKAIGALVESAGFKEALTLRHNMPYETLAAATLTYPYYGPTLSNGSKPFDKQLTADETVQLAACMDEDYLNLSYQDLRPEPVNKVLLTFNMQTYNKNQLKSSFGSEIAYSITDKYETTIAWLKQHGYYDDMIKATQQLRTEAEVSMGGGYVD
jgi:hypothetical protein